MKYYILTLGCQMNKSDSERIAAVLESMGYENAARENEADLIALNACSVRQTAVDRIHGKIKIWNAWKKQRPLTTILTGCVLSEDKKKLREKFDIILDIRDLSKLPQLLNHCSHKNSHEFAYKFAYYFTIHPRYTSSASAYIPIMTGCNNFCAYCAVPRTRGREQSRSVKEVLHEIRTLADNGCLEATLLGQNVNTYRPADAKNFSSRNPYHDHFAAMLWEVNQINGIQRVHFTAPHPKDMTDEVIDALTLPKHVRYLHLPLQSGDNEILKRMNRGYTSEDYSNIIKNITKKLPDIALGTDIIVGFPGETKEQFQNTVDLYKKIRFDISYTAMYSPRPGTPAARMNDDVPREEKKRRWKILQDLMEKITLEKNQKLVGQTVSMLVDRYENDCCIGQSLHMKQASFPGEKSLVGKIVDIKIEKTLVWELQGVI